MGEGRRTWALSRTPGLLLAVVLFALYEGSILGRILWRRTHNPPATAFLRARLRELRGKDPRAQEAGAGAVSRS